ncbi:AmmeMemoRadiSam system protein B [Patescibacteria group bacterium]|nr:AmmeMemoRadiSam system protein B [Patescibacteria group bacterium]
MILQGGLLFFIFTSEPPVRGEHRSLYITRGFYDEAYELAGAGFELKNNKVVAVIVPHHLFVKDKIASLFKSLGKFDYDQIIMIGPDHLNDAGFDIVTSRADWATPYGKLNVDSGFTDQLLHTEFVDLNEKAMAREFAISGLVPFVKKTWPNAKFVPLILSSEVKKGKLDQLINFIQKNKSKKSLLIASVDFSHYKSPEEAEREDEISNLVIKNFEVEKALEIPVDSPQSIYLILNCAQQNKAINSELLSHTNTGLIQPWSSETAVTHNIWALW